MVNRYYMTLAALALILGLAQWPAAAADKPAGVDPATGKRLNEAVEQLKANRPAEARATLGKLQVDKLSPYARSRVEQILGSIDQAEKKYVSAREHFSNALASGGLSTEEASTVRLQIAQLYSAEQNWREAAAAFKQAIAAEQHPEPATYYSLAVVQANLGDNQSAVESAQKAVEAGGSNAKENWLQLLLNLRIKRQEYQLALPVLQQLIALTKK